MNGRDGKGHSQEQRWVALMKSALWVEWNVLMKTSLRRVSKPIRILAGSLFICLVLIYSYEWISTTNLRLASPDGKFSVHVTAANSFAFPFSCEGPEWVEVTNLATRQTIFMDQFDQGGMLADWEEPYAVKWSADSRRFCLFSHHTIEPSFQVENWAIVFEIEGAGKQTHYQRCYHDLAMASQLLRGQKPVNRTRTKVEQSCNGHSQEQAYKTDYRDDT